MQVGRVVLAVAEGRLAQEQVGPRGEALERLAGPGVPAVGDRPSVGGHPERERVDGVDHRRGLDAERADLDDGLVGAEVELLGHPRVEGQVVGARHPPGGVRRPPHRDPRLRPGRVVLAHHVVAAQVEAVVRVQVTEEDGVDGERVGVPVELSERAVAEVDEDAPGPGPARAVGSLGLEEVAAGAGVGSGVGARAADDGEPPHLRPPANWEAPSSSAPRKRRPIVSNSSGRPVVAKEYVGSPDSRIRSVRTSIL